MSKLPSRNETVEGRRDELESIIEALTRRNQLLTGKVEELAQVNCELREMIRTLRGNEEQFRRAIEDAPIPVIMHAEDGEVLQISKTWTELTGYSRDEIPTFDAWMTRAYGTAADSVRDHVRRLFSGEANIDQIECETITQKGERRTWLLSASSPGTLRDGRRFVVGMALDVTDRKRAEAELAASQERLRLVVENLREYAIFATDLQRCVTNWNAGAEALLGYSDAEIIGTSADVIFTPEDRAANACELEAQTALTQGRAADERWHMRKDGSRFWGSGVMMPMRDADGNVLGFVKIFRDESEVRATREALEQSRENLLQALEETERARNEAESAARAKDHFLAILSHELRTPLTPVLMAVHTLARRKDVPPAVRDALDMIRRNVEIEVHFIDDLLDLTRIARKKLALIREPLDLHEALRRAINISEPDLDSKKQRLTVSLKARKHHVVGDATRLQQVFWNLLKNASKFTPEAGSIRVATRNRGPRIQIEIADTGLGFEPEDAERIFDAFTQANEAVTRQFGGLGLGLAISKAAVEAHGGKLRGESAGIDQGATFVVELPLAELNKATQGNE
jgi:two-component system CheB/CheR fusion protein